ncbi:MAG: alpha/beta fold hydrolase [Chloroflexi bacterium]|nr:alpha/beta fold hydrolase [Chloroflexota bacterium]MCI0576502.1 alpha/beta fold hydrolase [Chloroflexota bacterium]MCI0650224.1 alpha/beta fold hydrolase [Chloroflexota bacterium]MCI0729402.1 alpha/beta fold hydrolase [Chloroflexota bacterium]
MTALDPLLTRQQARRVAPMTLDIYREMEEDANFRELGSAMGWAYAELWGQPFDVGHYYLYVPRNRPEGPRPTILFLHGSAGNFKSYTWVWSRFAEQHGAVIVAPSFGFGNWLKPGGREAIFRALDHAQTVAPIDPRQVYLAGLSNGGLGVSQAAAAAPERFTGLIFLSPVMATDLVESQPFLDAWRGRPVLVITGEADERISLSYVDQRG